MASADAVAQGLECCICLEYFNEPKNLSCGHSFCKKCLCHLYKSHPQQNQLSCPICRQITTVSNGDISKLQTNILIKSLVDEKLLDKSNPVQPKFIADHAKGVEFIKSGTPKSLGELHDSDWQLDHVSTFPLSYDIPCDAVPLPDGRVAVGYSMGKAIEMFTVDGPQETVRMGVLVWRVSVLSDGRYVVRDFTNNNITMYTQAWERLSAWFNTLSPKGNWGGMCVDRDDNIYFGRQIEMKIVIFRPEGGARFREIQCQDLLPWDIHHMNHSRRLVVCDSLKSVRVIDDMDEQGTILHQIKVERGNTVRIAVLKDDSILVAYWREDGIRSMLGCWKDGMLSIELYTADLIRIRIVLREFPMAGYIKKLVVLPTGEIAIVSDKQFIVFHKI